MNLFVEKMGMNGAWTKYKVSDTGVKGFLNKSKIRLLSIYKRLCPPRAL